MTAVEVCPICDIAGCHHIRDRKSHQMTDEELDALVKQAMDRAIERLQKLHSYAGRPAWDQVICEELSQPFTTLRAQLAEARVEIQRLDGGWHTANSEILRVSLIAKEAEARADRAEAALATAFGDGLRTAISVIASIGYGKNEDVDAGHEEALRAVEKYLTDWTSRSQPHDRTALERHDAKTREKALREAADAYFIPKFCTDNDREKVEALHAFRAAILALIEVKP